MTCTASVATLSNFEGNVYLPPNPPSKKDKELKRVKEKRFLTVTVL